MTDIVQTWTYSPNGTSERKCTCVQPNPNTLLRVYILYWNSKPINVFSGVTRTLTGVRLLIPLLPLLSNKPLVLFFYKVLFGDLMNLDGLFDIRPPGFYKRGRLFRIFYPHHPQNVNFYVSGVPEDLQCPGS